MPIIKSAKKALRQNITNRRRNIKRADTYKSAIKDYKKAIESRDAEKTKTSLSKVYKSLDKAAKSNTIKKNKADRMKSHLTKLSNKNQA